jgi:hypothetical protein
MPQRISVTIGIGYSWNGSSARRDQRWKELSSLCRTFGAEARKRAAARLIKGVSAEDDETPVKAKDPSVAPVRVVRLRGSVGSFTWESITAHIMRCDIALFDLSEREENKGNTPPVSSNVWVELGYALARDGVRVFVVSDHPQAHARLPSDLAGMMVGHVPRGKAHARDQALRASLVSAIADALMERSGDGRLSGSTQHPTVAPTR